MVFCSQVPAAGEGKSSASGVLRIIFFCEKVSRSFLFVCVPCLAPALIMARAGHPDPDLVAVTLTLTLTPTLTPTLTLLAGSDERGCGEHSVRGLLCNGRRASRHPKWVMGPVVVLCALCDVRGVGGGFHGRVRGPGS